MRILVDNSSYHCLNMGDMAMLQITVERLRELWPEASIGVLTAAPEQLARFCPDAQSVPAQGKRIWLQEHYLLGRFQRHLPVFATRRILALERRLRLRWPHLARTLIRSRMKLLRLDTGELDAFLVALQQTDLYLYSGAGILTDAFTSSATGKLHTLELAHAFGIPTALLGQGIGPLQAPELRERARAVLPRVDLIALRERRMGPHLLRALGVSPQRIRITGDDALELAYRQRPATLGTAIGANLRVASYAQVDRVLLEQVQRALQQAAAQTGAPVLPLPISHHAGESDVDTLRFLLSSTEAASDGGCDLDTPLKVITTAGHCRVVVTGSYHAAVFALAQGVPVVALAKSAYYADKFHGLAELFGGGCAVVALDAPPLADTLVAAITAQWASAETLRPALLAAAETQIQHGRAVYRELQRLVHAQPAANSPPQAVEATESAPRVSVLMSVYNGQQHLEQAIRSILNQTFTDFEFIIIDDGSQDASWSIIQSFATQDRRIVPVQNPHNLGLIASLNRGLHLARGSLLARHDADDIALPERLQRQVQYLEQHPAVGVLGSWAATLNEHGLRETTAHLPTDSSMIGWTLLFYNCLVHPTVILRRSVLEMVGDYSVDALHAEDYDLWMRMSTVTRIANLPEVLVHKRRWAGRISATYAREQEETAQRVMRQAMALWLNTTVTPTVVADLYLLAQDRPLVSARAVRDVTALLLKLHASYTVTCSPHEQPAITRDAARRLYSLAGKNARRFPVAAVQAALHAERLAPRLPPLHTLTRLLHGVVARRLPMMVRS